MRQHALQTREGRRTPSTPTGGRRRTRFHRRCYCREYCSSGRSTADRTCWWWHQSGQYSRRGDHWWTRRSDSHDYPWEWCTDRITAQLAVDQSVLALSQQEAQNKAPLHTDVTTPRMAINCWRTFEQYRTWTQVGERHPYQSTGLEACTNSVRALAGYAWVQHLWPAIGMPNQGLCEFSLPHRLHCVDPEGGWVGALTIIVATEPVIEPRQ
jgi:hypothetical protein